MKISKEAKVGIVTALAIACFIYGFNFLKGKNLFSTQRKFYAVYTNIDGLVEANPIMINGFIVGMVGDIELVAKDRVVVTLTMKDDIEIPENSVAKVVSSGILGSKAIELGLGNGTVYAESGDTLASAQEDDLKSSVNKIIAPLQKKAVDLISSIDSVMTVVQLVFNESARENLAKSFENIKNTLGSLETTSYRLDTMVISEKVKISSILTKINVLATTLANNSDKLDNVIKNFSSISDSLAKANITSTINNTNIALTQASEIMAKINKGEGTMGLLVNDSTLYNNLNKSSVQLEKLLKDVRINPKRYIPFGRRDNSKPTD